MSKRTCPVCGYKLSFEPWTDTAPADEICPSCGIQFGYDDAAGGDPEARPVVYQQWREDWIRAGMPWRSAGIPVPDGWDPEAQLAAVRNRF